jgi:hypothetical protein
VFADLDPVGEHALDAIDPRDQVARSGCMGLHQQICPDLLVGGDRIALDDEASGWSGRFRRHGAEADVDGIGEDVRWEDGTVGRSHRVAQRTLDSSPTRHTNSQMVRSRQPTRKLIPVV